MEYFSVKCITNKIKKNKMKYERFLNKSNFSKFFLENLYPIIKYGKNDKVLLIENLLPISLKKPTKRDIIKLNVIGKY